MESGYGRAEVSGRPTALASPRSVRVGQMRARTVNDALSQSTLPVEQGGGLALAGAPGANQRTNSLIRGTGKGNPLLAGGPFDDRAGGGPPGERTGVDRAPDIHTHRNREVVARERARVHCAVNEVRAEQCTGEDDIVQASPVPGEAMLVGVQFAEGVAEW